MKEFVVLDSNGQWKLMKSNDWMVHSDYSDRDSMPEMKGNKRASAIEDLASKTKTRKNTETGETEFLLHRGVGEQEAWAHDDNDISDKTSWTPHYHVAHSFARIYNSTDPASKHREFTMSAWVPESKIHSVPIHDLRTDHAFYNTLADEHEVVVKPHSFQYADNKTRNSAYNTAKKNNRI